MEGVLAVKGNSTFADSNDNVKRYDKIVLEEVSLHQDSQNINTESIFQVCNIPLSSPFM